MKLRHILAALLLPMAGLAQAQDMKTFMDDKRDNREANYEKWGPTSDRDGLGFIVRAGYVIGGTSPLPLPAEIRKINEFSPKGGFSLGVDGYKYFNTRWGISAGLRFFMQGMHTGANVKNYGMSIVMGEDVTGEAGISAEDLSNLDYLLVMDHSETPTTKAADVVLPGVTFAEKYGTMVNVAGRIQRLNKAIEPLGEARADWEIMRELTELLGCDCPRVIACPSPMIILEEIASEIEAFNGLTWGKIGNEGIVITETGVTIPLIEREKAKK